MCWSYCFAFFCATLLSVCRVLLNIPALDAIATREDGNLASQLGLYSYANTARGQRVLILFEKDNRNVRTRVRMKKLSDQSRSASPRSARSIRTTRCRGHSSLARLRQRVFKLHERRLILCFRGDLDVPHVTMSSMSSGSSSESGWDDLSKCVIPPAEASGRDDLQLSESTGGQPGVSTFPLHEC